MVITAALLLWSGSGSSATVPRSTPPAPAMSRRQHTAVTTGVGSMAGLLSGLLGIGGGVVMVPAFRSLLDLPIKRAIATSLVCVGCFAVPGTLTHAANDDIDWSFAFWLAVGVVPGAALGARAAIRADDHRLRVVFGSSCRWWRWSTAPGEIARARRDQAPTAVTVVHARAGGDDASPSRGRGGQAVAASTSPLVRDPRQSIHARRPWPTTVSRSMLPAWPTTS